MGARAAPARAPFPHASARTPNRPPPYGHAPPPTPTAGRARADAARRGRGAGAARARARFKSRQNLDPGCFFFALPQWPPRNPNPAHPPRRHSRLLTPRRGAGGRSRAAGKLAIGARPPRAIAAGGWRIGWSVTQGTHLGAPPPPRRCRPHRPPRPLTPTPRAPSVGCRLAWSPLSSFMSTLSLRRPSPFRSGAAHRHGSDDGGASLRCALFCLSFGGGPVLPFRGSNGAPLHHSQSSSWRSSQHARRLR